MRYLFDVDMGKIKRYSCQEQVDYWALLIVLILTVDQMVTLTEFYNIV